jgi:RimJ/RimL family protein N-acetyltransferase
MMKSIISLKLVTQSDGQFLYKLLLERESVVNISHKKIPTFQQHLNFINSKPYSKWYIIKKNDQKIGSIYLSKQDEIGIFVKKEFQKEKLGIESMELLMIKNPRSRYLANINPKNLKSTKFFKKFGFKLIQHTYELTTDEP